MARGQIRVAINGGGIAGAALLHALRQYPHLDVHIFEAAAKFREAGVAMGFGKNAQASLDLIGPSATQCLKDAGSVPLMGIQFYVATGSEWGTQVYSKDAGGKPMHTIVQRATLLHELLAGVPEDHAHAGKKLTSVEEQEDGSVLLRFADDTTHECDILIGADGIRSVVRRMILGDDDPAAHPRNTGWFAIFTLHPYDKAVAAMGQTAVDSSDARERAWCNKDLFYLHNLLSGGKEVQFSVCAPDREAENTDRWQKFLTADEVKQIFVQPNNPPHLNKAVVDLLCDKPEQQCIYFYEHPNAHTYVKGPLAVMGDAAHATSPWQASGGGMSIEDAMVLSTLLGRASTPDEACAALRVYDRVRRPRTQRIVESSLGTSKIFTGNSDAGLDPEKVRKALAPRWEFIVELDLEKHREEAIALMDEELKAT